jgi:hypothetical protein
MHWCISINRTHHQVFETKICVLAPNYDDHSTPYPVYDSYDDEGMMVPTYDGGWVFERFPSRDMDPSSQEPCMEDDIT